jgi:MFS family permease
MFGTAVFLAQYMQLARGANATQSGLMTIPMMAGLLIVSTIAGALISKRGKWKAFVVTGSILQTAGLFLLGTIHYDTNFVLVSVYMFLLGAGVGMVMQNLVLVVQNAVPQRDLGVASSAVTFFRSLGGTAGVAALGALLAARIPELFAERSNEIAAAIGSLGTQGAEIAQDFASGTVPVVHELPEPLRGIIEGVYGDAVARVFLVAAPLGLLTFLAVVFLPNLPLSTKTRQERATEEKAASAGATAGLATTAVVEPESAAETGAGLEDALAVRPHTDGQELHRGRPAGSNGDGGE